MAELVPPKEEMLAALRAILGWPEISRSPQLARFLEYIVQRKLDGETQSIKAYSIAVDVLGRPPDFDPQADPIVRVQARRLRALLDQYYLGPGAGDPIRIELPVGRYVPEFVPNVPAASTVAAEIPPPSREPLLHSPAGNISVSWFILVGITLVVATIAYLVSPWGPRADLHIGPASALGPSVIVTEFPVLSADPADAGLASGLAVELVTDLSQFETIDAIYGGSGNPTAGTFGVGDYVLSGIVRHEGERLLYSAILTEVATAGVVWSKTIPVTHTQARAPDVLDYVSRELSMVLGSLHGPIHVRTYEQLKDSGSIAGEESPYVCRILFDIYRETGSFSDSERASACFLALDERMRNRGAVLAAQASLVAEYVFSSGATALLQADRFQVARSLIEQALVLSPTSGFVWEQKARLDEGMGRHAEAEAAYRSALQLNPARTDAIAAYARHLAFLGKLDEAKRLSGQAIAVTPDTPAWYYGVPTLVALREGRYGAAVEDAVRYARADSELGPVLAIMAAQGSGDSEIVSRYLPQVLEAPSFRTYGVLNQLGRRIGDGEFLERVRVSLSEAGVPPQALLGAF